jgi:ribose transport system permease protein
LSYTRIGTRLLAIGSLRASAERAGVRVDRFVFVLFVVVGAMAGLAGFIDLSRFASTTVSGHTLDSLAAATAAVIGGTAIMGGRISVIGTVWGALLAVILQAGLVVVGLKSFYQQIAIGLVLIVAVTVDELRNRSRERR